MIKNKRQYCLTNAQAQKFELALAEVQIQTPPECLPPILHQAQMDALQSQLADLRHEIADYESLV